MLSITDDRFMSFAQMVQFNQYSSENEWKEISRFGTGTGSSCYGHEE